MALELACKDLGMDCDFVARGETVQDLMAAGGVIRSDTMRHPQAPLPAPSKTGLIELARRLDAMVLRWGR